MINENKLNEAAVFIGEMQISDLSAISIIDLLKKISIELLNNRSEFEKLIEKLAPEKSAKFMQIYDQVLRFEKEHADDIPGTDAKRAGTNTLRIAYIKLVDILIVIAQKMNDTVDLPPVPENCENCEFVVGDNKTIGIKTPFNPEFVKELKATTTTRKWNKDKKIWTIEASEIEIATALIIKYFQKK